MRNLLIALLFAAGVTSATAATKCPEHYYQGKPPALSYTPAGDVELCNDNFANFYDPERKTPVYAAERLTPHSLTAGVNLDRANNFHADARVPHEDAASPADYKGGDYDRGHMAPDHDMPTVDAKKQSDSLANIVPQSPQSNRGLWAQIEKTTRRLVVLAEEGYVVTGPIYDGKPELLNERVAIPTRLFKAVYRPAGGVEKQALVGVYVVNNAPGSTAEVWSLDKLKGVTGIDAFPALGAAEHAEANLPAPSAK